MSHALRQWSWLSGTMPLQRSRTPADAVRRRGLALLPSVLSAGVAAEMREFVLEDLRSKSRQCVHTPGIYQPRARRGAPQTRWDLCLPIEGLAALALRDCLSGGLGGVFSELCGTDAPLWEFAVFVSAPDSVPQQLHADTDFSPGPCLYTAFVALQDVTWPMGPTHYLPNTHVAGAHELFGDLDAQQGLLEGAKPEAGLLKAGDAALYDSRLLHGGAANRSDERRALLTITFRHPDAPDELDNENCRSIHPAHRQDRRSLASLL